MNRFISEFIFRMFNRHRDHIGGLWDIVGKLQFDFLLSKGLKPHHFILDVGCGCLRGGVHFINYLDKGHYYGVDNNREIIEIGAKVELRKNRLFYKKPNLFISCDFNFTPLNKKFDFILAQSVFTHLNLNDILLCLINIEKVLKDEGTFFATFFENYKGFKYTKPLKLIRDQGVTFFNKDGFHYDFRIFSALCSLLDLRVDYIGEWNHPRGQKMMSFRKKEA